MGAMDPDEALNWGAQFRAYSAQTAAALRDALLERVLPAFDSVPAEADVLEKAMLRRTASSNACPEFTPEEKAQLLAEDYRQAADRARVLLIEGATIALYHLVERQMIAFVIGVGSNGYSQKAKPPSVAQASECLVGLGIDPRTVPGWTLVEELRLIANVLKHGDGSSARDLYRALPNQFTQVLLARAFGLDVAAAPRPTTSPLGEHGLQVLESDFRRYCDAVVLFWSKLADELEARALPH